MEDYVDKLFEYRLKGYCCSQILLQLGLDEKGSENSDLINAIKGLCGGLYSGLICGALSGGACLLSFFEPDKASDEMIPLLVEWFKENFEFCDCKDILGDDPMSQVEKCPVVISKTYEKVIELLEDYA